MQIGDNYDLRNFKRLTHYFCWNRSNAKTLELQTGDLTGWDRSSVAFMKTRVVSQFATVATTNSFSLTTLWCENKDHSLRPPPLSMYWTGTTSIRPVAK